MPSKTRSSRHRRSDLLVKGKLSQAERKWSKSFAARHPQLSQATVDLLIYLHRVDASRANMAGHKVKFVGEQ